MKTIKLLFASALLLCLWGCDSVTSTALVGEKPVSLVAEEWDGTWLNAEGAVTLKVTDASQGKLRASWIEESGDELKLETWNIQIRSSGSWSFANVRDDGDDQEIEERYLFTRVKKDNRQILFWMPDTDAFTAAVKAGQLPGEISDSNVRLTALNADHLAVIKSDQRPTLFDWDEPLVLLRVRQ
jgi:hypothetical protein